MSKIYDALRKNAEERQREPAPPTPGEPPASDPPPPPPPSGPPPAARGEDPGGSPPPITLPGLERFPDRFWRSVLRVTAGIQASVRPRDGASVVAFTGADVGVGTSTLALATALQLVRDPGVSVLLVDAQATEAGDGDLPARAEGLIQLALGQVRITRAVVPTDHPGLGYLPRGGGSYNGPKLIERVIPILGELRATFDHVILDTAPVVIAPEAARLASVADGTVVVLAAERTPKVEARRVREVLDEHDAPLLGSVINRARRISLLGHP